MQRNHSRQYAVEADTDRQSNVKIMDDCKKLGCQYTPGDPFRLNAAVVHSVCIVVLVHGTSHESELKRSISIRCETSIYKKGHAGGIDFKWYEIYSFVKALP